MIYYKNYAHNMCRVTKENNGILLREVDYG